MSERHIPNMAKMMSQIVDHAPSIFEHTSVNEVTPAIITFENNIMQLIDYSAERFQETVDAMAKDLGLSSPEQLFCARDELLVFQRNRIEEGYFYTMIVKDLRSFLAI